MVKNSFIAILALMSIPSATLAGTYDALCNTNQKCVVKVLDDQLIVGDKTVPIQAIASWSKSGPGVNSNSTIGAIATWLVVPVNASAGLYIRTFQSRFSISYYTPEKKVDQVSIDFANESVSRFFETEIQVATDLPQGVLNDKASQFKWNTGTYLSPQNTINNP
jgi:hypothetical protein